MCGIMYLSDFMIGCYLFFVSFLAYASMKYHVISFSAACFYAINLIYLLKYAT